MYKRSREKVLDIRFVMDMLGWEYGYRHPQSTVNTQLTPELHKATLVLAPIPSPVRSEGAHKQDVGGDECMVSIGS